MGQFAHRTGTTPGSYQIISAVTGATMGGNAGQFEATGACTARFAANGNTGSEWLDISSSTQYSFYIRARTLAGADRQARAVWQDWNGAAFGTEHNGSFVTLPADGSFVEMFVTATSDGTATLAVPWLEVSDSLNTELYQVDVACFRAGAVSTFVPSLRIVGDLDLRANIELDDYTDTAAQAILDTLVSNAGYRLAFTTGGEIEGRFGGGAADNTGVSSGLAAVDGARLGIRATMDISSGTWTYYKDDVSFNTDVLGVIVPTAGVDDLHVGTAVAGTTLLTTGAVYWAEVRDGIDGPVVARMDSRDAARVL